MKHTKVYKAPAVLRSATVEMENPILAGSVVTKDTKIEPAGQKVDDHSFADSSFESKWE